MCVCTRPDMRQLMMLSESWWREEVVLPALIHTLDSSMDSRKDPHITHGGASTCETPIINNMGFNPFYSGLETCFAPST